MLHVVDLTDSQLQSYRSIWGSFLNFNWTFSGPGRTFGFYGRLGVDEAGAVELVDLCVACSGMLADGGSTTEVAVLREAINRRQTAVLKRKERHEFRLDFISKPTRHGNTDNHLVLTYGDADDLRDLHFELARPKQNATDDPLLARNQFYPVSERASPTKEEKVTPAQLSCLLSQTPAVAMTGAGISVGSGIPSFQGDAGLERHFPLHEVFPGAVAGFMVEDPFRLAQILAQFQAAFIQAEPNAAHKALAHLEERGVLRHIVTGNDDKLHERAGSRSVHLKSAEQFGTNGKGWDWLNEGKILLAIGLGKDEHGLISYCRDRGIQVVAVSPHRPDFLHVEDLLLEGKAEEILPGLKVK